jgi:hypothetical protein
LDEPTSNRRSSSAAATRWASSGWRGSNAASRRTMPPGRAFGVSEASQADRFPVRRTIARKRTGAGKKCVSIVEGSLGQFPPFEPHPKISLKKTTILSS